MDGMPIPVEVIDAMAQLGVAGLMGLLWVWERMLSRRREGQLSETHDRLMQQHEQLKVLVRLIYRNTQVIERFDQTQSQLIHLLEQVQHEIRRMDV